jgi:hypothetical protein
MKESRFSGGHIHRELNELDDKIMELNRAIDRLEDLDSVAGLLKEQRESLIGKRTVLLNTHYVVG